MIEASGPPQVFMTNRQAAVEEMLRTLLAWDPLPPLIWQLCQQSHAVFRFRFCDVNCWTEP